MPPAGRAARGRIHRLFDFHQVPDLTFDYNIRARRRRRRRLSGWATQTGRWGGRTALVCPSPARMAARQPSDSADLSLQAPKATVTLGQARTSPTVQIDAAEHRRGSADHIRRWNHPGTPADGPRGRPRTRQPPPFLAILRGNAPSPDLTVRCYVRPQRRRRRRLSGWATQTGRWGGRTALVCPSPARMAARQPSDSADLSLQAPKATVTLGQARTSPTVQIDAAEHRRGSADHIRRWNHPGTPADGPQGGPRTHHPYGSRGSVAKGGRFKRRLLY